MNAGKHIRKKCARWRRNMASLTNRAMPMYMIFWIPKPIMSFTRPSWSAVSWPLRKWGFPGLWFIPLRPFRQMQFMQPPGSAIQSILSVSASLPQSTAWESRWKICGICILRLNAIMRIMQRSCVSSQTRWAQKISASAGTWSMPASWGRIRKNLWKSSETAWRSPMCPTRPAWTISM